MLTVDMQERWRGSERSLSRLERMISNCAVRDGQTIYQQHIDLIAGKTITLKP